MGSTKVGIKGSKFYINGKLTYSDIEGSNPGAHGLLMNARFIQGVFDDKGNRGRYARFGYEVFDPDANTDRLIEALPEWYRYGLRAFTVGFQGGGPCFTINNHTINNNPYSEDGTSLDGEYVRRMEKLIIAADNIGMVVIVSFFYGAQTRWLKDDNSVRNAVKTASNFLRDRGFTNVIIEIANEHNINEFKIHPILYNPEGIVSLIDVARRESGGMPVGCSGGGGYSNRDISMASDVVLIHGNGCSRQHYYNLIMRVREWEPDKPIVCNEDSQAVGQLEVAFRTKTSWGYYNNITKQEPPANWGISAGEDTYFAYRMAEGIGIKMTNIHEGDRYCLQGFESNFTFEGKRWIRLASLYPEEINFVDFFRNGDLIYTAYDEPYTVNYISNWLQGPCLIKEEDREWKALIHLRNGRIIEKTFRK